MEIEEDVADNTLRDVYNSSDNTKADFYIMVYYSFQIIPSLKTGLNMLTYTEVEFFFDSARLAASLGEKSCCSANIFSSRVVLLLATFRLFLSRDTSKMCHHFVLMITTKTTQPRRQVFSVNCSMIGQFCCPIDDIFHISQIPPTLVMNYTLDFNQ